MERRCGQSLVVRMVFIAEQTPTTRRESENALFSFTYRESLWIVHLHLTHFIHFPVHIHMIAVFHHHRFPVPHFHSSIFHYHSTVTHGHVFVHIHSFAIFHHHHFAIFHHYTIFPFHSFFRIHFIHLV